MDKNNLVDRNFADALMMGDEEWHLPKTSPTKTTESSKQEGESPESPKKIYFPAHLLYI